MDSNFSLVAGSPALDFTNTVDERPKTGVVRGDMLADPKDIARWAKAANIHLQKTDSSFAHISSRQFKVLIETRELLYRMFTAKVLDKPVADEDLHLFTDLYRSLSPRRFERVKGHIALVSTPHDAFDQILECVIRSAADILTTAPKDRLKMCAGDDCGWLFLDTSKNNRRCWCDMSDCGNRAKARRFYARETA